MSFKRAEIMQALARGYCSDTNKSKVLDVDLIEAMADEVLNLEEKEYCDICGHEIVDGAECFGEQK